MPFFRLSPLPPSSSMAKIPPPKAAATAKKISPVRSSRLLLPSAMFRSGEETFLDDLTRTDVQNALQVPVDIVKSSGRDFVEAILAPVKEESSRHGEYEPDPEEFAAQMDDNWQEEDLDGVQVSAYEPEDLD